MGFAVYSADMGAGRVDVFEDKIFGIPHHLVDRHAGAHVVENLAELFLTGLMGRLGSGGFGDVLENSDPADDLAIRGLNPFVDGPNDDVRVAGEGPAGPGKSAPA